MSPGRRVVSSDCPQSLGDEGTHWCNPLLDLRFQVRVQDLSLGFRIWGLGSGFGVWASGLGVRVGFRI